MPKKSVPSRSKKRLSAAFIREVNLLAEKHGLEGVMVGQVKGRSVIAADADKGGCPPGKTLTRVTFKDEFGNTINTDVCI